jgi:hypothetical protein
MNKSIPEKYGITRMDHNHGGKLTRGYNVRIQRSGKRYVQFFADGENGGEIKALEAAKEYRNKILKDIPSPTRADRSQIVRRKTSSGIVGVTLITTVDTRRKGKKYVYEFWKAWWSPQKGIRKVKIFSVNKYGSQQARQLAIKTRENGLKQMQTVDESHLTLSQTIRRKRHN